MILTVTPNPTLDRVIFVRDFRLGAVVRGEREVLTPSGKGVDASLVIHELDGDTVAAGLSAGHNGRLLLALLDERGIRHDFLPAEGETRAAVVLVDLSVNRQSTITAPTLTAGEEHLALFLELLERHAAQAWGVILAGSLPPGLPEDSYAHLLRRARQRGLITLLDTSGRALRAGVAGMPHILKINADEFCLLDAQALGGERGDVPPTIDRLYQRLTFRLGEWASEAVIVTLGEHGVLAATTEGCYRASPPSVPVANTAGAGDAVSGGVMLARSQGAGWSAALALGIAAAASVVMNEGTAICRKEEVEKLLAQVQIERCR